MNISAWIKNNKFLALALVFTLINAVAIFAVFGFKKYGDTVDYVDLIHWMSGENSAFEIARILRPLGPFLALPFEFLGDGAGLVVQNIFFYFLAALLVFKITDLLFQNKKQAFLAVLLFITASPLLESGLAYLTDMGAWFFYLLSVFLTLLYFKNKDLPAGRRDEKLVLLNGFLSGVGVLMKENGGLGCLFFGLMVLFSQEFSFKQKILKIIKFGAVFIMPIAALQIFAYNAFRYTSLDWLSEHSSGAPGEGMAMTLLRYFGQLFRVLGILWIFFFAGLWRLVKDKDYLKLKIFLAMVPASLSFLLWEVAGGGRAAFIFAPLGILLASYGLKKNSSLVLALVLSGVVILNYCFAWLNPTVPFADIVAGFLGYH